MALSKGRRRPFERATEPEARAFRGIGRPEGLGVFRLDLPHTTVESPLTSEQHSCEVLAVSKCYTLSKPSVHVVDHFQVCRCLCVAMPD